jgi:hypothetical protein
VREERLECQGRCCVSTKCPRRPRRTKTGRRVEGDIRTCGFQELCFYVFYVSPGGTCRNDKKVGEECRGDGCNAPRTIVSTARLGGSAGGELPSATELRRENQWKLSPHPVPAAASLALEPPLTPCLCASHPGAGYQKPTFSCNGRQRGRPPRQWLGQSRPQAQVGERWRRQQAQQQRQRRSIPSARQPS